MSEDGRRSLRALASGASVAVLGRFGGRLIAMLGDVVAARVLGPAVFGIYSIGWTIFRLFELIVPLGFDMGVIRYGSRFIGRDAAAVKHVIVTALRGTLLVSLPLGLAFFLAAPWLGEQVFQKPDLALVIRFFAFGFPLAGLLTVLAATTRLTHVMTHTVILQDFGQPWLAFVLLLAFLAAGSRLIGVILSDIISYAVLVVLGGVVLFRLFPEVMSAGRANGPVPSLELYGYSLAASLTTVLNTMVFWVDRLLVGYFLSAADAGVYQAVSQISVFFAVVLGGLSRIVVPILATLHHGGMKDEMEEIYRVSTKWGIYVSVPVLLVLVMAPEQVLFATYGGDYTSGAILISVLLIGQVVNLITGPVGPLLVATGHQNLTFVLSGLSFGLNVALNLVLVPRWGLSGAAIATSISLSTLYLVALFAARRNLDLWPYDRRYWKGLAATLAAALVVFLLGPVPLPGVWLSVLLKLVAATVVFFGFLFAARLDQEDFLLIRLLTNQKVGEQLQA